MIPADHPRFDIRLPEVLAPEQPMLVFVHGAMDRGTSFDRVRRRFATFPGAHPTVAYDRRGYADSVVLPFGEDPFADHVADLLAVLHDLQLGNGPLILIGHSAKKSALMLLVLHKRLCSPLLWCVCIQAILISRL